MKMQRSTISDSLASLYPHIRGCMGNWFSELSWVGLAVFLLTLIGAANAFEADEHRLLANTALRVVAQEYECGIINESNKDVCDVLSNIKSFSDAQPSYGKVVECVDNYLTPEKMLASFSEMSNGHYGSWPNSTESCETTFIQFMQASHNNHTHFQKELIVSLDTYHSMAISLAKEAESTCTPTVDPSVKTEISLV